MATYSDTNVSEMIFNVLDSATYDNLITNNQVSSNQLYLITDDDTYLPLAGGTMTGSINRYYSATSTSPMIALRSNNIDTTLFQVGHATSATGTFSNNYRLIYKGTGSSPNNYLQLIANTGSSSDVIAMQVNENGNVSFTNTVTASISGNAATATAFSAAKSVALTGDVTGSASSTGGWSIATTIGAGKVTNNMLAGSIANGKLANSTIGIAGSTISLGGSISATDLRTALGLSSAMRFVGTTTTAMTDGSTTANVTVGGSTYTPSAGDVVLYSDSEFVWTGSAWERLGRDSSFKVTQTAVAASDATSSNDTAVRFVYSIAQDTNGVISVTTRPLPTYNNYSLPIATYQTLGGVKPWYSHTAASTGPTQGSNATAVTVNAITTTSGKYYAAEADNAGRLFTNVPWTDTKVTSVDNHYSPSANTNSALSASASGATAAWSIDVVKAVQLQRDAKGHVTGITVTSGKIPANPNTDTDISTLTLASDTGTTNVVSLAHGGKYKLTAGTKSVIFTLPSDNNTDTLVKQTAKSDNVNYKILMTTSASPTSGNAAEAAYDTDITINPNTNTITATNFAGNASTATKLAASKTINGTAFDGSGNITTANWGTSRTITIGSTGKSVNGSGNVSWSHSEIGATVSNSWTNGTTAGPTITTTVNGVSGTAVAIPSATASVSGVVTTDTQTFAGNKTFNNNIIFANDNVGIQRVGRSTSWIQGRNGALLKTTSISSYSPIISTKTTNGSWEIGAYDSTSYTDDLVFTYCTDTNYTANTNTTTAQIKFLENSHIVADLDGNATTATRANITSTANAVAYYTNTTGTFGSKASANGALYATSANGALQWGTLPVGQGGTGNTNGTATYATTTADTTNQLYLVGVTSGATTTLKRNTSITMTGGALAIGGNTTIGGTLTVGTTSANKATTLNGTLSATGNTTIGGTFTVGTTSATKATTLNGTLSVTDNTTIGGTLTVGTASTNKDTTLNGNLTVTGNTTLGSAAAESNKTITMHGHVVINPSYNANNSYNEGIRINLDTNGWANINFGGSVGSTSGTTDGQWIVGRRGAAGTTADGGVGAVGDFTIEEQSSNGTGLTLHKDKGGITYVAEQVQAKDIFTIKNLGVIAATQYSTGIRYLTPNMANTSHVAIAFGKEKATKNAGNIEYYHHASASAESYVALGFYGAEALFKVYTDGRVQIINHNGYASLNNTYGLRIGPNNNTHLDLGYDGLQALNSDSSAASTLYFQYAGGNIQIGKNTTTTSNTTHYGNILAGANHTHSIGETGTRFYQSYIEEGYFGVKDSANGGVYIRTNNVNYCRLYTNTVGTAGTATTFTDEDTGNTVTGYTGNTTGVGMLTLGNSTAVGSNGTSYASPGTAGNANNARGYLRMYSSGANYTDLLAQGNGNRTCYLPNYAGTMYLVHGGGNSAIGSATLPVYVAANGRVTACTASSVFGAFTSSTNTLSITVAGQARTASIVNSISNTWTAGTTAGPTIKTTVNGVAGTAVAIPSASGTASGIVTTGAQTFAGAKTFSSTTASTSKTTGAVIISGGLGVAGSIYGNLVYGAVWNDYAEYRNTKEEIEAGRVIQENGDDTLRLADGRLLPGCEIVSDTFGFAIGKTEQCGTPVAATGRVLAYPYEDRELFRSYIGSPVCSGPNGTVSIMTEEEEMKYPSRIIGTISAVPDYEEWGEDSVKVNGRVWIRIK